MSTPDPLSREHRTSLEVDSAISPEVIAARGYRTITVKAELRRLGFSASQTQTPALLIPVSSPTGEVVLHQIRPDFPRIRDGKPVKYEIPARSRMALDVPPSMRHLIGDPSQPLFVTEGIKKGDSLASRGVCTVALLGVWNFRGRNELGGKVALAEWEQIALNGRTVYVVFDSDVMVKHEVHAALARLKAFLESRGAMVKLIYLPHGESGGKLGVDDFFGVGRSLQDLLALATEDLRPPPGEAGPSDPQHPYRASESGLVLLKVRGDDVEEVPLTNFNASIVAEIINDDGAEIRRSFDIQARLRGRSHSLTIPAGDFAAMTWPLELMGPGAIVRAGLGLKDHARAAIQFLSEDVPQRLVYSHTGWREMSDGMVYLHAGGAIGSDGLLTEIATSLEPPLAGFSLPAPPGSEQLRTAIQASVRMLDVAADGVTVPVYASIWRAVLGGSDYSVHVSGGTGAGKSELVALAQQHFGPAMDARHLPGSWTSTANALEAIAFATKDALLAVDDFAPNGSSSDILRLNRDADRVFRAQGNGSGRTRMRADTTIRPSKPPRGLILSTGEDTPKGQSLQARILGVELPKQGLGSIDWERLTICQRDAAQGIYAEALSGYIQSLAPRYQAVRANLREEVADLRREAFREGQHRRTPDIVASLGIGIRYFLAYAQDVGAFTASETDELWKRCWSALLIGAESQSANQADTEPAQRFIQLLGAAISSGRAHIAGADGAEPDNPEAWGWRLLPAGTGDFRRQEWRSFGERIGWTNGQDLYLGPDASYAAAQKLGKEGGDVLPVSLMTLRRRLKQQRLLVSTDESRNTVTVRRTLEGVQRAVFHLRTDDFYISTAEKPDIPDISEPALVSANTNDTDRRSASTRGRNVGNVGFTEQRESDTDGWGSV